jgi:hypothetical protein
MSVRLSISDFSVALAVCELRYANAYRIFDRTGEIMETVSDSFSDLLPVSNTPQQSTFSSKEGTCALELSQCRFMTERRDPDPEVFGGHCKTFFGAVVDALGIRVFSRVGLRIIFRKEFGSLQEAKTALTSCNLSGLKPGMRFGASEHWDEAMFRWEGVKIGGLMRMKAEKREIHVGLTGEAQDGDTRIDKVSTGVTVDVDYYTVAPVEPSQWDPATWVPQSMRIIRKEVDRIMQEMSA